jgi:hypothetical protein
MWTCQGNLIILLLFPFSALGPSSSNLKPVIHCINPRCYNVIARSPALNETDLRAESHLVPDDEAICWKILKTQSFIIRDCFPPTGSGVAMTDVFVTGNMETDLLHEVSQYEASRSNPKSQPGYL